MPGAMNAYAICHRSVLWVALFFHLALLADSAVETGNVPAHPLKQSPPSEVRELGVWDDAIACAGDDFMILRRGDTLYRLPMIGNGNPEPLVHDPELGGSKSVTLARAGEKLWLLVTPNRTGNIPPFALEVHSGLKAKVDLAGLKLSGKGRIQSHVILPHVNAALLMVDGVDPANRPVFAYINLQTGKVVTFPFGWDLSYFSENLDVAVLETTQRCEDGRRYLQGIDLRTGERIPTVPDRKLSRTSPFSWTDVESIRPLYVCREGEADRSFIAGIVTQGTPRPFQLNLEKVYYLSTAKEQDGFAGFQLRPEGGNGPQRYYQLELRQGSNPEFIGEGIADFSLLGGGNSILVTTGHGHLRKSKEAIFRSRDGAHTFNILDGIERMPPLPVDFVGQDFVTDQLDVKLIDGFGSGIGNELVLCLFTQNRMDMRSIPDPRKVRMLERSSWENAILVDRHGSRWRTTIKGDACDDLWFHKSGKLIMSKRLWNAGGYRVNLSELIVKAGE